MGNADLKLTETWTFRLVPGAIQLHVDRTYDWLSTTDLTVRHNGMLSIGWARVWDNIRRPADGGDLPIGNAYTGSDNFYLSQPNGMHCHNKFASGQRCNASNASIRFSHSKPDMNLLKLKLTLLTLCCL